MKVRYTPTEGTLGNLVESPSDGCASTASPLSLHASLAIMSVSSASKLPDAHGSHWSDQPNAVCCAPDLQSWLCGSTKEPSGFVANHYKPRGLGATSTPIQLMTWPPRSSRLGLGFVAQPRNHS
jgi:hypothetical protein